MNKANEVVIIELIRKQEPILVDTKTRKKIPAENLTSVKLVDDIVEEIKEDGKVKKVKQCICVEDGEPEVYLKKHADPSRAKASIKRIDRRFGIIRIFPDEEPAVLDFFNKSFENGGKFSKQYKILDPREKAKEFAREDRTLLQAKGMAYSEDKRVLDRIKKYAVVSGLIGKEDAETNEPEAIGALVSMTINPDNAAHFLELMNSDRLERQFEMLEAIERDIVRVDNFKSEIIFTDTGQRICTFPAGMSPAIALADYTQQAEGASTYQYIHEKLRGSKNIELQHQDLILDDLSLLELIETGIRVEAISDGPTGYRFANRNIGGTNDKVLAHFENYPEKVSMLKTAIEERLQ